MSSRGMGQGELEAASVPPVFNIWGRGRVERGMEGESEGGMEGRE